MVQHWTAAVAASALPCGLQRPSTAPLHNSAFSYSSFSYWHFMCLVHHVHGNTTAITIGGGVGGVAGAILVPAAAAAAGLVVSTWQQHSLSEASQENRTAIWGWRLSGFAFSAEATAHAQSGASSQQGVIATNLTIRLRISVCAIGTMNRQASHLQPQAACHRISEYLHRISHSIRIQLNEGVSGESAAS